LKGPWKDTERDGRENIRPRIVPREGEAEPAAGVDGARVDVGPVRPGERVGGQADALLHGGRGEGVANDVRGQVLGEARAEGDLVEQALGAARPVRELLVEGEVVLESCGRTAGHGHDTDLGFLAVA